MKVWNKVRLILLFPIIVPCFILGWIMYWIEAVEE